MLTLAVVTRATEWVRTAVDAVGAPDQAFLSAADRAPGPHIRCPLMPPMVRRGHSSPWQSMTGSAARVRWGRLSGSTAAVVYGE